ncbi:hypothetical protein GW17_00055009, partial [Ensete ventricosum]
GGTTAEKSKKAQIVPSGTLGSTIAWTWRYHRPCHFQNTESHVAAALSLGHLFLHRPPLFLSSLPPLSTISTISLPSLTTRSKSHRQSPTAPAFCSQPLPPVAATTAFVSSSKKIVAAALVSHGRCLLPSPPAMSSPWPPAASSYASSPWPATEAKPSFDATTPVVGQPLPPQSQPKPSPMMPLSSSSAFSSLYRSPRRTLLPPSSLPNASIAAKPSSTATLISSSSSPPNSRCHLPSQP